MNIEQIHVGRFDSNCFIVWDKSNEAIVIDPGSDAEVILSFLNDNNLSVAVYLLTHGHGDHVSALSEMYESAPAPIAIHSGDMDMILNPSSLMQSFYDNPMAPPTIERTLEDNQEWTDGGMSYKVMSTPGHSQGSVCFLFDEENVMFSGDTLFAGSIGRTDFPGGDMTMMNASLLKLADMSGDIKVYPGHGPATTIELECQRNPFIQELKEKI